MKKKRLYACIAGVLMSMAVFAGALAIAAEYGTQDDPLVSLSYINSVFAPDLQKKAEAEAAKQLSAHAEKTENMISTYSSELERRMAEFVAENTAFAADTSTLNAISASLAGKVQSGGKSSPSFALVKLTEGQTMICSVGTEVLLRLGSATCVSSGNPGLIDTTDATNLSGGGALSKNHLYLCTVAGRGVRAPSGATLLVRGEYSIQ